MGVILTTEELAAIAKSLESDKQPNATTIILKLKIKRELGKKLGF